MAAEPLPIVDDNVPHAGDPSLRIARAEGYRLLGELLLWGATPALCARAQEIEPLAVHLRGADFDEIAAEHHRLFEREVYPYASIFLAPGSNTGGHVAELARDAAQELGTGRATLDVSDDHLGSLLVQLSRISFLELQADAMDNPALAAACRERSVVLLDDGVLSWVALLRTALAREPESLWTDVVLIAHELACAHRAALRAPSPAPELPERPSLLDDDSTRLRDIARYVLTPCYAGVFLSVAAVTAVARSAGLPTGFGSREQRLAGLLQSAADYGDPPAVLRALAGAVDESAQRLRELGGGVDHSTVRTFAARADETVAMLRDAAEQATEARAAS